MSSRPSDDAREVILLSGLQYIGHMWVLGVKLFAKALIGVIATCVILAVLSMPINILCWIIQPNDAARNAIMGTVSLPIFLIVFPIAIYVGGSTVGFRSRISSATFARRRG